MNFIYQTIQTLLSDPWYGVSENVEITKGKNQLITKREDRSERRKRFNIIKKNK